MLAELWPSPSSTWLQLGAPGDKIKVEDERGDPSKAASEGTLQPIENIFIFFLPFDLLSNIFFILFLTFYFHLVSAFD